MVEDTHQEGSARGAWREPSPSPPRMDNPNPAGHRRVGLAGCCKKRILSWSVPLSVAPRHGGTREIREGDLRDIRIPKMPVDVAGPGYAARPDRVRTGCPYRPELTPSQGSLPGFNRML